MNTNKKNIFLDTEVAEDNSSNSSSSSYTYESSNSLNSLNSLNDNDDNDNNDNDELSSELDDLDLVKTCSREDLFRLIRENPEHYLKVIVDNQLTHQLNILVNRVDNGQGLNIKFKLFPDDRWTEVGYWGDESDEDIYEEFKRQIDIILSKNISGRKNDKYAHLGSQLDNNNNILSENYGGDIPGFKQKFPTSGIEQTLVNHLKNKPTTNKTTKNVNDNNVNDNNDNNDKSTKTSDLLFYRSNVNEGLSLMSLGPENLKNSIQSKDDQMKDTPMEFLDQYVAELIEKIIEEIPTLLDIDITKNYHQVYYNLNSIDSKIIPENYKKTHHDLLEQIKSCEYVQKVHKYFDCHKFPEFKPYVAEFHRMSIKQNPNLYTHIKKEALLNILDQDDQEIMSKYCLDVQEIWIDFLLHQD